MNNKIYPCLWFDGKAKEAAEFYCSIFKGAKITTDTPMVVMLEIYGKKIMGLNGGPMFTINPSISLFVLCENIDETNKVWEKLADGGKVMMPIDKYFWSERYGWVQDKFGMTWQVSVVDKAGDPPKISPSMLFVGDQFGNAGAAVKLYTDIFSNSSTDVLYLYPEGDANAGKVMFSEFKLSGYNVIAMDGPGNHAYDFNEAVSFVVDCDEQEEVDYYWDKFIGSGGKESMCGWLEDKFGVSWQIVPKQLISALNNPDREKAAKSMQAMLKMKKIIVKDLID